jgi:hypothetical protein
VDRGAIEREEYSVLTENAEELVAAVESARE